MKLTRCLGALSLVGFLASCSWLPDGSIRVAVPDDPELRSQWSELRQLWQSQGHQVPLEIVNQGSFPPADLVWVDSASPNLVPEDRRRPPTPELVATAAQRSLAPGWFSGNNHTLPLLWSPWAWWKPWGAPALPEFRNARILATLKSAKPFPVLIPSRDKANLAALATQEFGGDDRVWEAWGTRARNQGQDMEFAEAARLWKAGEVGLLWASYQAIAGADLLTTAEPIPPSALEGEHQFTLVAQVRGLVWDSAGWNPRRVVELLDSLWSPQAQVVLQKPQGWLGVTTVLAARDPAAKAFLVRSLGARTIVGLHTAENE